MQPFRRDIVLHTTLWWFGPCEKKWCATATAAATVATAAATAATTRMATVTTALVDPSLAPYPSLVSTSMEKREKR